MKDNEKQIKSEEAEQTKGDKENDSEMIYTFTVPSLAYRVAIEIVIAIFAIFVLRNFSDDAFIILFFIYAGVEAGIEYSIDNTRLASIEITSSSLIVRYRSGDKNILYPPISSKSCGIVVEYKYLCILAKDDNGKTVFIKVKKNILGESRYKSFKENLINISGNESIAGYSLFRTSCFFIVFYLITFACTFILLNMFIHIGTTSIYNDILSILLWNLIICLPFLISLKASYNYYKTRRILPILE